MAGIPIAPRYVSVSDGAVTRQFTDRREAFRLFRDILKAQTPQEQRVLNFYGVGGIGKSRLQQELRQLLEREQLGHSVRVDFQAPAMRRQDAALYQLRHCLAEEHGVQLPLFDIAYAIYWQRANPTTPLSESHLPLLKESEILSDIITGAGGIPIVGAFVGLVKALDALGRSAHRWHRVKNDADLQRVEQLDMSEMLDALSFFFARDLLHHLQDGDKMRLVIFLDALEALREDITARGAHGDREAWIRDLVVQTPGVLWVMSSRDALRWAETDHSWVDPYLVSYLIGDLSSQDRLDFLSACGIAGQVAKAIAEASEGVPFYLNVSVDHWERLRREREPQPQDFGTTQADIVNRFVGHVSMAEEELLKLLSVPRSWDRSTFELIVRHFNVAYPLTRWPDLCAYSFTRRTSGGRWVMHALMRDELLRRLTPETRTEANRVLFEYERTIVENEASPVTDRVEGFREAVWNGLAAGSLPIEWFADRASFFMYRGLWDAMRQVVEETEAAAERSPEGAVGPELRAYLDYLTAWIARQRGQLKEASSRYERLDLGQLAPHRLGIEFQSANVARELGNIEEAGAVYARLWADTSSAASPELRHLIAIQYADFHYVQGRFADAIAILDAVETWTEVGAKEAAEASRIAGHVDRMSEAPGRGVAAYELAKELFSSCEDVFGLAEIETNLAEALWLDEPAEALSHGFKAIDANERLGSRLEIGKAKTAVAYAHLMLGETTRAARAADEAIETQLEVGYRSGEAQARLARACIHLSVGNAALAADLALQAERMLRTMHAYPTLQYWAATVVRAAGAAEGTAAGDIDAPLRLVSWADDGRDDGGAVRGAVQRVLDVAINS